MGSPVITLLTDFGLSDTYVGQVKGAILAVAPGATLVDLTHAVPPQDVRGGAFALWSAVDPFPAGTIHLAVVDPGVGTARRALAIRCGRGDLLVGPDNGLLVPAAAKLGGIAAAAELADPAYRRPSVSSTFHGRDLFGPAAGHLASGVPPERMGPLVADVNRPFAFPVPVRRGSALEGEVLHVDVYGTLVSNVPSSAAPPSFTIEIAGRSVDGPSPHFEAVAEGELLALPGSAGLIEIAVRNGSAASSLGARAGEPLRVRPR